MRSPALTSPFLMRGGHRRPLDLSSRLSTSSCTVDTLSPRLVRRLFLSSCLLWGGGCESTEDPKHPVVDGDAVLQNVNNYTSTLDLNVGNFEFDPATPITIDWSLVAAGTNMRKEQAKPIELVIIAKERGTHPSVEAAIEEGTVKGLMPQQWSPPAGVTSASLTDIVVLPDYFVDTTSSFILSFATGNTAGEGIQAVTFITPLAGSPTTTIQPPPGSDQFVSFTPVFGAPLDVPTTDPGSIGWGAVELDSQGQVLNDGHRRSINRVLLAYFAGQTSAQLQNETTFLQLETLATELYQTNIAHAGAAPTTAVQLSALLKTADSTPFARFAKGGTWIFAAMCDTCNNPALVLSLLNPIGE